MVLKTDTDESGDEGTEASEGSRRSQKYGKTTLHIRFIGSRYGESVVHVEDGQKKLHLTE